MRLLEQAKNTIEKYGMLRKADCVIAGVSGGADSVALLHFLLEMKSEYGFTLMVLHLNHGLRGEESNRDEVFVKALCEQLNVECSCERVDIKSLAREKGISIEEAGRLARYDFFERERNKRGPDTVIAVGHTLNDSLETALINLARGTALRGLCGIPPKRGHIIRPLIECERAGIEEYLRENGYSHIDDSSNDRDDYARNRIRHSAMPALESVSPAFLRAARRSFAALRQDADYLDKLAADALERIKLSQSENVALYSKALFAELPKPIRMRVLLQLFAGYCDTARLKRLDSIIEAGCGAEQLAENVRLVAGKRAFRVECGAAQEKKLRLLHMDYENYEEKVKSQPTLLNNALDCAKINGIILERQRLPGDKLKPCGQGCTKTLKKLYQEAWVPPIERKGLKLLADGSGVVWAERIGAAQRVAPGPGTEKVIAVEICKQGEM
jgi:tRNA(Ile)-lysidine synthase